MEFALAADGARIRAVRGTPAACPQCSAAMIPKCGRIVVHHWAHEANDCDPWWEPETEWHRKWKRLFPDDQTEVTRAGHRADIVRPGGMVVELQHSAIAPDEILAREQAYGSMIWLFDGTDSGLLGRWIPAASCHAGRLFLRDKGSHHTFRWMHPRKHYATCRKPVYIDLGEAGVFLMKALHLKGGPPYGGWGNLFSADTFSRWLVRGPNVSIAR